MFILDVNLGKNLNKRLTLYKDQDPRRALDQFCFLYMIEGNRKEMLWSILQEQIKEYQEKHATKLEHIAEANEEKEDLLSEAQNKNI